MRTSFFVLPIHRSSELKYYDRMVERQRSERESAEAAWNRPFDEIPMDARIRAEDSGWLPPWLVNNLVGFIVVGFDRGRDLSLHCFLRRKYFPRGSVHRQNKDETVERNNWFLYYSDDHIHPDREADNNYWRRQLLREIRSIEVALRKRLKGIEVWRSPAIKYFDFVGALQEAILAE